MGLLSLLSPCGHPNGIGIVVTMPVAGCKTVFGKQVVRQFHAASLILGALVSRSGFSQTGPAGCQLRVFPDQRSGFCARAFA